MDCSIVGSARKRVALGLSPGIAPQHNVNFGEARARVGAKLNRRGVVNPTAGYA